MSLALMELQVKDATAHLVVRGLLSKQENHLLARTGDIVILVHCWWDCEKIV
jgi:hypothetical protein